MAAKTDTNPRKPEHGDAGPTILVVDDDEDVRDIVAMALEEEGYRTVTAPHGLAALERLQRGERPAAIILDLMMPVMNGWDFWDRIQQSGTLRSIPVVILTATGLTQGSFGRVPVLPKPVSHKDLIATVDMLCAA